MAIINCLLPLQVENPQFASADRHQNLHTFAVKNVSLTIWDLSFVLS